MRTSKIDPYTSRQFKFDSGVIIEVMWHFSLKTWVVSKRFYSTSGLNMEIFGVGKTRGQAAKDLRKRLSEKVISRMIPRKFGKEYVTTDMIAAMGYTIISLGKLDEEK